MLIHQLAKAQGYMKFLDASINFSSEPERDRWPTGTLISLITTPYIVLYPVHSLPLDLLVKLAN